QLGLERFAATIPDELQTTALVLVVDEGAERPPHCRFSGLREQPSQAPRWRRPGTDVLMKTELHGRDEHRPDRTGHVFVPGFLAVAFAHNGNRALDPRDYEGQGDFRGCQHNGRAHEWPETPRHAGRS